MYKCFQVLFTYDITKTRLSDVALANQRASEVWSIWLQFCIDIVWHCAAEERQYIKVFQICLAAHLVNNNQYQQCDTHKQVESSSCSCTIHFISPDSTLKSTLRVVFHFRMFPMLQVCKPGFWLAASSYASVRNPAPRKMPPQCGPGSNHWLCVHQNDSVLDMFSKDIRNTDFILFLIYLDIIVSLQSPWWKTWTTQESATCSVHVYYTVSFWFNMSCRIICIAA